MADPINRATTEMINNILDGTTPPEVAVSAGTATVHYVDVINSSTVIDDYYGADYYGKDYYFSGGAAPTSVPDGVVGGYLQVRRNAYAATIQILYTNTAANSGSYPVMYTRATGDNGVWTDWEEQAEANGTYENMTVGKAEEADKLGTETVGSPSMPIYLNEGTPTECNGDVGSSTKPVYMSSGTITACSSTVGDTNTPVYMLSGTITAGIPNNLEDMSWAQISAISQAGKAASIFHVGQEKKISLSTGEEVTAVILGFNHDELSDGSGKAGITFGLKNALETTYSMNSSATNSGGWESSEMRERMSTFKEYLPSDLQGVLRSVNKLTAGALESGSGTMTTTLTPTWTLSSGSGSGSGSGTATASWSQSGNSMSAAGRATVSGIVSSATVTSYTGGLEPSSAGWTVSISRDYTAWTSTITFEASRTGSLQGDVENTTISFTYTTYTSVTLTATSTYTLYLTGYDSYSITAVSISSYSTGGSGTPTASYSGNTVTVAFPTVTTNSAISSYSATVRITYSYTASGGIASSSDDLFLFSHTEVFGTYYYNQGSSPTQISAAGEGHQYDYFKGKTWCSYYSKYTIDPFGSQLTYTANRYYQENAYKGLGDDATSAYYWWFRSPYSGNSTSFCCDHSSGYAYYYTATATRGVVFGFCV